MKMTFNCDGYAVWHVTAKDRLELKQNFPSEDELEKVLISCRYGNASKGKIVIFVHRWIAAVKLGERLGENVTVKFLDGHKTNLNPDNIAVYRSVRVA